MHDEPWPKPAYAWWVVVVLLIAYTVSFVDRTILSLLIPSIRQALDISDTQVSLLVGFSFALFYTLLGLPLGLAADRGNRRRLIAAGITVWSLFTAACGLASTYTMLFLARIGVGVGEATLSPSAYSLLGDYFPKEKLGRVMAIYSIGVPLGSGVALILSGLVIKAIEAWPPVSLPGSGPLEPWRLAFLFVGLPGLLVALLMLTVKEPVRRGAAATVRPGIGELVAFVRQQWRALLPHFAGLSALTFVIYGYMAWIPTFFARTYGVQPADIALVYGVTTAICGAIGLLLGGAFADRLFSRGVLDAHLRIVRLAVLTSAPFLIAMPLMPDATLAAVVFAPAFLLASMHGGVAGAALQVISPNRLRGQITALYFFVANLIGLGLGPTAVALVTDYGFGDDAALRYSLAVVAAVALPISALILTFGFPAFRRAATIGANV